MEEETLYLDGAWSWLPACLLAVVALAAIAFVLRRKKAGRPWHVGTVLWTIPFDVVLCVLAAAADQGLVQQYYGTYAISCITIAACGIAVLGRERSLEWPEAMVPWSLQDADTPDAKPSTRMLARIARLVVPEAARTFRDAAIIALCCGLSFFALELPWNTYLNNVESGYMLIEAMLILGALGTTYFLGMRTGVGPAIITGGMAVLGIAQYYTSIFKNAAITPSDVLALGTAMEVLGGYDLEVTSTILVSATIGSIGVCLCAFMYPRRANSWPKRAGWIAANLALAAVVGSAESWLIAGPNYKEDYGVVINAWQTMESYKKQCFLPTFVRLVQSMSIDEPEGYTEESAQEELAEAAATYDATRGATEARTAAVEQFNEIQPTVIAVMNETFSDMSVFKDMLCDYTGPVNFKSIPDSLYTGELAVSVYGGGTCNSEFEFLTGVSRAYIGDKTPYVMFDLTGVDNLAAQFNALGYKTTAMHPQKGTNWNRNKVYTEFGFSEFYDIDDFDENSPVLHNGMTDATTYEKILELLEEDDSPQFIFDVTMQNHGGYTNNDIPADKLTTWQPAGVDPVETAKFNEYISCITASDQDLADFIAALRELDRPVVLIFFGDHKPSIAQQYNDVFCAEDLGTIEHIERTYSTEYVIWANYDVAGADQTSENVYMDASTLAAKALESIGAPLTDMQKARLSTLDEMPIMNMYGYTDSTGVWHALEASAIEDDGTQTTTESQAAENSFELMCRLSYLTFATVVQ